MKTPERLYKQDCVSHFIEKTMITELANLSECKQSQHRRWLYKNRRISFSDLLTKAEINVSSYFTKFLLTFISI